MKKAKAASLKPAPKAAAPVAEPECCGSCHNWREEKCKRFPPVKVPGLFLAAHRDMTAATDWCGEWRARQ